MVIQEFGLYCPKSPSTDRDSDHVSNENIDMSADHCIVMIDAGKVESKGLCRRLCPVYTL